MVDFNEVAYDRLCHNNQDGDEQVLYTYDQGSSRVKSSRGIKVLQHSFWPILFSR